MDPQRVVAGFSKRQLQVFRGITQGLSEKQIANALGLSVHTVHVYVKDIYVKAGVSSRAQLLAQFVPTSLLEPEPPESETIEVKPDEAEEGIEVFIDPGDA